MAALAQFGTGVNGDARLHAPGARGRRRAWRARPHALRFAVPLLSGRARDRARSRPQQGDCARCHVEDEHRASMVPDLRGLSPQPTADGWRSLIVHGKPGTLMPAFRAPEGGPLTPEQIDSLVEYLTQQFAADAKK